MLGGCPAMREVFALIKRIAPADSTVLVAGESGTGKEMVARAIHQHSRRRDYPLLACDCTALAPTLLESELFGHVKGSFSGAIATKRGLFEVAHQGTLFLDEVANLSLETQGKLLRVLESRRLRKVGDTAEHEVDIRLIATTNRSLAEMVKTGAFRADLYYRLNVVPISLPPLRERPGDVPLLADCFLRQFARQMGVEAKGFSCEAMRQMEVYAWPGNVRELRNIVERISVLYGGLRIERDHLPWEVREAAPSGSTTEVPDTWEEFKSLKRQIVENLERQFLIAAMNRSSQNITQAAEDVGMQRPNFHALLAQPRAEAGEVRAEEKVRRGIGAVWKCLYGAYESSYAVCDLLHTPPAHPFSDAVTRRDYDPAESVIGSDDIRQIRTAPAYTRSTARHAWSPLSTTLSANGTVIASIRAVQSISPARSRH